MAVVNQWGKRLSTDAPFAEPEAQRRRLDENSSSSNTSSDNPSVKSRALPVSPFEQLPDEVTHHLLRKMDDRTQGALACTSKLFARHIDRARWDQAGSLVENGELHLTASHDDHVRFYRGTEKLPDYIVSRLHHNEGLNQPALGHMPMTDHEIGFRLGCRYSHISLRDTVTPQLMTGLATASRWRSLSLKIDLARNRLSELLEPLIDGLDRNASSPPRELFLEIVGCHEQSRLVVPDLLWNGRIELVGLDFGKLQNFESVFISFERAVALRYLSVWSDKQNPIANILKSIGSRFPAIQNFQWVSEQCILVEHDWTEFFCAHPHLQTFSVRVEDPVSGEDPSWPEFQFQLPTLNVRRFDLSMSYFTDPEGGLADWITRNQRLEELNIEANDVDAKDGVYFIRLAKAIGSSQSLRNLSMRGIVRELFNLSAVDDDGESDQLLINLLSEVACNRHLSRLVLTNDLYEFPKGEKLFGSQILKHFELLESAKPELSLMMSRTDLGSGITENSVTCTVPATEFISRFGWRSEDKTPVSGDCVEFQVKIPTWGQGAFRKFVEYSRKSPERKEKYILGRFADGSLLKENIQILRVIPATELQQNS